MTILPHFGELVVCGFGTFLYESFVGILREPMVTEMTNEIEPEIVRPHLFIILFHLGIWNLVVFPATLFP